jgi:two-component system chemotaxis response regulator CheB
MTCDFFIVAIGSSAGGLSHLKDISSIIPVKANAAFVLIPHLVANYKSNLDIILSKYTNTTIIRASHKLRLLSNTIYLLLENTIMTVKDGLFILRERRPNEIVNNAIDIFFSSLAIDAKEKAIGEVLSSCGQDGLSGVRQIAINRGLVMVQDPETAEFPYMPNSILKQEHPDYLLSPKEIVRKIIDCIDISQVKQEKINN